MVMNGSMGKLNVTHWGHGASAVDALTSEEAIEQGGLNWGVYKAPVYAQVQGNLIEMEKHSAIVRDDNDMVLSIMGSNYTPLQNKDKFRWVDELVAAGGAVFTSVGYFGTGAVNWLLAKLPSNLDIGNEKDILQKYLLFADSYNGTMSFTTKFTTIRPVCYNTFRAAIKEYGDDASKTQRLRHTPGIMGEIKNVQRALGLADAYYAMLGEELKKFGQKDMNFDEAQAFFQRMVGITEDGQDVSTRADNISTALIDLYQGDAMGAELAGKTAWGALNAVTEFVDWHRSTHGDSSNRIRSAWFGSGEKMKQKAFDLLLDFTNDNLALVPAQNLNIGTTHKKEMEIPTE